MKGRVERQFPLKSLNTWRIGGLAEAVFWPENEEELMAVWLSCHEKEIPVRLFGRGSNVLFPDEGLTGVTIISTGVAQCVWGGSQVRVGAGYSLARLSQDAAECGYTGLEFARGIPGTVGGAIVMNAGAHGGSIQDVLVEVKIINREGKVERLGKEHIEFGYRECSLRDQAIVLEGVFCLKAGDSATIRQIMSENLAKRKVTQPLELPNAGSVFRNPDGDSAGRLIEAAGWKGKTIGGAQVSLKHANFIVNHGSATALDVLNLIHGIHTDVQTKFGVELKTEVRYISPN
ncbi:UDP-N-acetylmuramate dehydrogenase [Desulfitobacterium dichloroeliminans LMG P-21439]|uniref:UDP-N-acetylenolpyruvoylglucosamine reductase n=1 Tax=Desulfitobacterium dichloroeliminans (strain LMG P-21439 / DCA1) TaxID=871963 RepID=L0FC33_DESDL|nr:UDP-N-acetylmuramate dehydrogenase [Desulfitobacterium dichloroeliminans]AGA70216.1 UDP-N-acetylmuramate dehydrogenase [Desulfitobacterium dichloroeliminans LMG P-21439]